MARASGSEGQQQKKKKQKTQQEQKKQEQKEQLAARWCDDYTSDRKLISQPKAVPDTIFHFRYDTDFFQL